MLSTPVSSGVKNLIFIVIIFCGRTSVDMSLDLAASTSAISEGDASEDDISFVEIIEKFKVNFDSRAAAKQLAEWGLVPAAGQLLCERCGQEMTLTLDCTRPDGLKWACGKRVCRPKQKAKLCRWRRPFRTGTFFAQSRLPLWKILGFAHLWTEKVALVTIGKLIQIKGRRTLVDWASFCREVVLEQYINESKQLGGVGKIVEINESKFGKRKYHRGHPVEGQWIFGGYECGSGRIFMVPIDDRSAETLVPLIKKWITPGTTIYSDFWRAYDCLEYVCFWAAGFQHFKVNHSVGFKDVETGVHTNCVESCWRAAKATMLSGGRIKAHIARNLARYMFVKDCVERKADKTAKFYRLAERVYNALTCNSGLEDGSAIEDIDDGEEVDEFGNEIDED